MRFGGVDVAVGGVAGEWVVAGGVLPVGRALLSNGGGVATAVGADVAGAVAHVFGADTLVFFNRCQCGKAMRPQGVVDLDGGWVILLSASP